MWRVQLPRTTQTLCYGNIFPEAPTALGSLCARWPARSNDVTYTTRTGLGEESPRQNSRQNTSLQLDCYNAI